MAAHQPFYNRYMLTRNRHVRSVKAGRHGLRRKPAQTSLCSFGWAMATHQGPSRWSPTLGGDAARCRPSASVARGGWQEIPQRAPRLGSTPGPRSSTCDIRRFRNIPGSSPLTPAKGQPKGTLGPPKGGLKGAAVRGEPLSSTAPSEALAGDTCPAGRGYNEAGAGGVPIVALSVRA
jgi:hypothetical protein